jgi:hypothetical protein
MAEPTSLVFWMTFWQEQQKIFLQFYSHTLVPAGADNKDCKDMLAKWLTLAKQQLLQNKERALMFFDYSIPTVKESKLKTHTELFINKFFEHLVEAQTNFFSKISVLLAQDNSGKYLPQLCELWLSCHEAAYQKMIFNEEYQKLYGQFINKILHLQDRP